MTNKITSLIEEFEQLDPDARRWTGSAEDFEGAERCWEMSRRFSNFLASRGHDSEIVHAVLDSPDWLVDDHWFTVFDGYAIDWTARQFHWVEGVVDNEDEDLIYAPQVFAWPGEYPLPPLRIKTWSVEPKSEWLAA